MARQNERDIGHLTEGPIIATLLKLSAPIVLANVLQTGYQLIDTFWVGRLGAGAVAAVSVSFPVIFLLISLGAGFGIAGSTLVAQYAGARNRRMVNHVAAQTMVMIFAIGVTLCAVGYIITPFLLNFMGVAPEVFLDGSRYLRISFIGMVFMFLYATFQAIIRGIGEVRLPLYIVAMTVLLNLVLDPLFIFGWGPVPGTGVAGAAYATVVTQGLSALIGIIVLMRGNYGIKLHLREMAPDFPILRQTIALGLPASIEQSSRSLGMMVLTFLVASFGTLTIAAYGIGIRVLSFLIIPAMGVSMAVTIMVGQNMGARNVERAATIAKISAWTSFAVFTAIGAVLFMIAEPLVRFFVPEDPALVEAGAVFVRIAVLAAGFMGVQQVLMGTFRGSGNMLPAMILAGVQIWVFQFPLAYVLSKHTTLGTLGLWWAFPAANVLTTSATLIWFTRGTWKKKKITRDEKFREEVRDEIVFEEGVQ